MDQWDEVTKESVRQRWVDLLVALVRAYPSAKRRSMWERVPGTMVSTARRTTSLDRWFTQTLRTLQIEDPGSTVRGNSLSSVWTQNRLAFRTLSPTIDQAEKAVLRLLRDETMTIVAEARLRWEEIKALRSEVAQ